MFWKTYKAKNKDLYVRVSEVKQALLWLENDVGAAKTLLDAMIKLEKENQ